VDLTGCVAFVSGGSGDLGATIAQTLAAAGAGLAVAYLGNVEGADKVVASVEGLGRPAWAVPLDQTDPASIEAAIAATLDRFGRLDVLVNNAAWNTPIAFPDLDAITPEVWDRMLDTNLRGPFLLARAAARPMRRQGNGRIVNIASIAGLKPGGSSLAYATSKGGLIHLTRCLALALGPEVLVNCVAPGLIEGTRMAQRIPAEMAELLRQNAVLRRTPRAQDIADQVLAFCRSDSVTGQVLLIDAGVHFH
jgi:NAD(P)-dependent dehydrogenase (short-subunit alcohol dehydrogenase family)